MIRTATFAIAATVAATAAFAQDEATLTLAASAALPGKSGIPPGLPPNPEAEQYGNFIVGPNGQPVYVFTRDVSGDEVVSCTGECLDAWPLVTAETDVTVGEGLDQTLAGSFSHEGQTVVTYNGWPLYYFSEDQSADVPQGHEIESFGGEWYLINAQGQQIEADEDSETEVPQDNPQ